MRHTEIALALLMGVITTWSAEAQRQDEHLSFALVISRHGVRAPITSAAGYSAQSWPDWEVDASHLTPHGAAALEQMGTYMRRDLADHGLFSASGCIPSSQLYIYSDNDERNISSSRATFKAFAPGCNALPIHSVNFNSRDPLFGFHGPSPSAVDVANARSAALSAEPHGVFSADSIARLQLLSRILAPDPTQPALKSLWSSDHPKSDSTDIIAAAGPRMVASEIVEDILLEYVDGKPLAQVGWGRVDEATLRTLMQIRVMEFNSQKRTKFFAERSSSNMLAHILETLEQGASGIETPGALGTPENRLVYISGHDGDLAGISGLLGLNWTADGISNDAPPDSQIIFELWRHSSGVSTIRIRYRAQSMNQLRDASPLNSEHPPIEIQLTPTGCKPSTACAFEVFREAASARLNSAYVTPTLMQTGVAP